MYQYLETIGKDVKPRQCGILHGKKAKETTGSRRTKLAAHTTQIIRRNTPETSPTSTLSMTSTSPPTPRPNFERKTWSQLSNHTTSKTNTSTLSKRTRSVQNLSNNASEQPYAYLGHPTITEECGGLRLLCGKSRRGVNVCFQP